MGKKPLAKDLFSSSDEAESDDEFDIPSGDDAESGSGSDASGSGDDMDSGDDSGSASEQVGSGKRNVFSLGHSDEESASEEETPFEAKARRAALKQKKRDAEAEAELQTNLADSEVFTLPTGQDIERDSTGLIFCICWRGFDVF
jgi:ribosomal RNA methyltransferase Nop2